MKDGTVTRAAKVSSAKEAIAGIRDGQTVSCVGVIGWITPDLLLQTLSRRFE